MEHGIVKDWNDMERIWQYVYSKEQLQTFSEEVSCPLSRYLRSHALTDRLLEMQVILSFLNSILCCSPKPPSTPARTGRRLQRFSSRPSTSLPSSSPCRLSLACKYARQKPLAVWFLGVGIIQDIEDAREPRHCSWPFAALIMQLTDLSTPAGTPQVAPPVSCLIRATA